MNYGVLRNRIKALAKDMRDAKQFGQEEEFQEDLKSLRFIVQKLTEEAVQFRNDSAFFEGELEDKGEEKWSPVVEAYRKRRKARLDAKEEEGRWVTTENDNHVHINAEGVPDKGNPYVLKAMTSGTRTREQVGMSKIQKRREKIRKGVERYNTINKETKACAKKYADLDEKYKRAANRIDYIDRIYKKSLEKNGIKKGDGDKLEKEVEELKKRHEESPNDREIEGEYNNKNFLLSMYRDTYSEEAEQARKEIPKLKKECDKAKSELDKRMSERKEALAEIRKGTDRNVQSIKFYSSEERKQIKDDFLNHKGLERLTEEDKEAIGKSIDSASDAQLSMLKNSMKNARIMAVEDTADPNMCSHYTPGNGIIYLEREDMSNPKVFWHEYGHYMDDFSHSGLEYSVVTFGEGSAYESSSNTFTDILGNDVKVFGEDGAKDLQDAFERIAPGKYKIKTNKAQDYISVCDAQYETYVDIASKEAYDLQKAFDTIIDEYIDGGPDGGEIGEYRRSIGYPDESDRPNRDDYIETYVTPKRKIEREREKYKGAEEEYYKKLNEFYDKQEAVKKEHPEYTDKINEMYKRRSKREKLVGPVCDCLCGALMGQVFSIYGCHARDYYRTGNHSLNEWAANIHQMMFTQDKEAIEFMSRIMPRTMKKVKAAYNEYVWRNMAE